jgi:hypothetical protein
LGEVFRLVTPGRALPASKGVFHMLRESKPTAWLAPAPKMEKCDIICL